MIFSYNSNDLEVLVPTSLWQDYFDNCFSIGSADLTAVHCTALAIHQPFTYINISSVTALYCIDSNQLALAIQTAKNLFLGELWPPMSTILSTVN